jgi:hypothetical protein
MQISETNFQVFDSNGVLVGYWHSADVSGTLFDWFAREIDKTMSTPLDMEKHTLNAVAADQTWYSNANGWSESQWETGFKTFLDTKFGVNKWKKLDKYKVTKLSW